MAGSEGSLCVAVIFNQKGGVGKFQHRLHLAASAPAPATRTLVVDSDRRPTPVTTAAMRCRIVDLTIAEFSRKRCRPVLFNQEGRNSVGYGDTVENLWRSCRLSGLASSAQAESRYKIQKTA